MSLRVEIAQGSYVHSLGLEPRIDRANLSPEHPRPTRSNGRRAFCSGRYSSEAGRRPPEALSGEQINPNDPRRWILIRREQGIADTEDGSYRWALDHLLIDQDAIPTLVETKRSDNSEIRRTVVGQMLDYAAFARRTWKVQDIRREFEESENTAGRNAEDTLAELLRMDGEPDADEFWQRVETNLRAARLRLLFVADDIPDELTRVVEFLNEQMPGIEVLAVEIKQFLGATGRTLVPRVIGRTTAIPDKPSTGSRTRMSRDEFLAQMPSPKVRQAAERLMNVAKENGGLVYSATGGLASVAIVRRGPVHFLLPGYTLTPNAVGVWQGNSHLE